MFALADESGNQRTLTQQSLMMNDPEQVKVAVQALQVNRTPLQLEVFVQMLSNPVIRDNSFEGVTSPVFSSHIFKVQ